VLQRDSNELTMVEPVVMDDGSQGLGTAPETRQPPSGNLSNKILRNEITIANISNKEKQTVTTGRQEERRAKNDKDKDQSAQQTKQQTTTENYYNRSPNTTPEHPAILADCSVSKPKNTATSPTNAQAGEQGFDERPTPIQLFFIRRTTTDQTTMAKTRENKDVMCFHHKN
jgi:hypothetical protein